jgi:hypothetical protein
MKHFLSVAIFLLAMLVSAGCFAEEKQCYKPTIIEEIYGTWINENYSGTTRQKLVVYDWGYCEGFSKAKDTTPTVRFTIAIFDRWTDAEGNV